jgi:hypothetical protein
LAVDFSVEDAGKTEWLWAFGSAPCSWSNRRITELGVSVKGSASDLSPLNTSSSFAGDLLWSLYGNILRSRP